MSHLGLRAQTRCSPRSASSTEEGRDLRGPRRQLGGCMRRRKLAVGAFLLVMFGMIGPSALANGSSPFSVTTSISTGVRTEVSTAPTFLSTAVNSGGTFSTTDAGNVAPTATVVETLVAGDN